MPQFTTKGMYTKVNYDSLIYLIDENNDTRIQFIFLSDNTEYIASTLLQELNLAVNQLLIKKRIQRKADETPYLRK